MPSQAITGTLREGGREEIYTPYVIAVFIDQYDQERFILALIPHLHIIGLTQVIISAGSPLAPAPRNTHDIPESMLPCKKNFTFFYKPHSTDMLSHVSFIRLRASDAVGANRLC